MKLKRNTWLLIIVAGVVFSFLFFLLLTNNRVEYIGKVDIALGTRVKVVVSADHPERIINAILREFHRIEDKFTVNEKKDDKSIISRINQSDTYPVVIDEETAFVIERSLGLAQGTNGAFDPALGKLIKLWGFDRLGDNDFEPDVPTQTEIDRAIRQSGYEHVSVEGNKITLENEIALDLGGIVKGYAIDRGVEIALEMDTDATGYIDAGGDIGIIGPKFGGDFWSVAVRDPEGKSDEYVEKVFLEKGAVVTSGDYERTFEKDGKEYHHILNPKTGRPVRKTKSSTVIAPNAMDADVLSTAAFVLGGEFASIMLPPLGGQGFFIDGTGKIHTTAGWHFFTERR